MSFVDSNYNTILSDETFETTNDAGETIELNAFPRWN